MQSKCLWWRNIFYFKRGTALIKLLLKISIIYYDDLLSVLQFCCNAACWASPVFCSCCSHAHPGKINSKQCPSSCVLKSSLLETSLTFLTTNIIATQSTLLTSRWSGSPVTSPLLNYNFSFSSFIGSLDTSHTFGFTIGNNTSSPFCLFLKISLAAVGH